MTSSMSCSKAILPALGRQASPAAKSFRHAGTSSSGWPLVLTVLAAFALYAVSSPSGLRAQTSHAVKENDTDAYFIVIDHSGSMKEAGQSGMPRWKEMQEHARQLLSQVPLDSDVQAATFSDQLSPSRKIPFGSESERNAAIEDVMRMCESPDGSTRLFDSMGEILERAEQVYRDTPHREVRVLVFTDGLDTSSMKWTRETLHQRFHQVVAEQPNIWLFFTQLQSSNQRINQIIDHPQAVQHAFKPPILLRTCPRTVTLKDPAIHPRQEIELEFVGPSPEYWRELEGKNVAATYLDPDLRLSANIGSIPIRPGIQSIPISFTSEPPVAPGKARPGNIQLRFPELPGHEIRAANLIEVKFEPPASPNILKDSTAPPRWRQPFPFRLANADEASKIEWLVDDMPQTGIPAANNAETASPSGESTSPPSSNFRNANIEFPHVGRSRVSARVTWPNNSQTLVEESVDVAAKPVDARARVELMTPEWLRWLIGGKYRLIDESEGDITERRWFIDDAAVEGNPDSIWLKCRSRATIRLVTTSPPQENGDRLSHEVKVVVEPVGKLAWLPYLFLGAIATWGGLWFGPLIFGRQPRDFRLYYSHTGIPQPAVGERFVDLGRFWRNREGVAHVPIQRLFPNSSYWARGAGANEQLGVVIRVRDDELDHVFRYTGEGSRFALVTPPFRDEHPGICCRISDNRCTDAPYKTLGFRLVPGKLQRSIPRILALIVTLAGSVALWWAWSTGLIALVQP